ncbi:MAG: 5'-methylthioadenosine/adenosylhomocysteine nucleosidase [Clostridia bacterium]|nr:5'-methylthioadenosine/adenosylhomocysteine nucleosidase [Clostridia bacterium]
MKKRVFAGLGALTLLTGALLTGCAGSGSGAGEIFGIIGAMDSEVQTLKEAARITKTVKIAGMEFCEGTLGKKRVVIVKCGMGKVNAGICASTLIREFHCTRIINTGVAGSLDGRLDIGDIVVSVDAVQHDFDVSPIGFARGEIPYTGLVFFPADAGMREAALRAAEEAAPGVRAFEGRICSGDQFISTGAQKEAILSNFGGMCCEMEGAAVAQTCYLSGTPFVVIRAVSDKPDGSGSVEYSVFEAQAAARCAGIVRYMVEHS